ncbi:hypothetical protein LCGC14_2366030 [marine sediment metagenome]|uniref:Uncharacterized protein n=1 Tax=marine sediment metagenome TaxID=412755 RepID=A0A0F9CSG7_9ZZZZ
MLIKEEKMLLLIANLAERLTRTEQRITQLQKMVHSLLEPKRKDFDKDGVVLR